MKENTKLINEDLNFEKLNNTEIATCIEMAYILRNNKKIEKLNEIITNFSCDGINTFSMFVLFCYGNYCKLEYWDIY